MAPKQKEGEFHIGDGSHLTVKSSTVVERLKSEKFTETVEAFKLIVLVLELLELKKPQVTA